MPALDDQLEQDLRAIRPQIDPGFEADLAGRVEAGFPRPARRRRRWTVWSPALGIAATALVAIVVVTSQGGDERDGEMPASGGTGPALTATGESSAGAAEPVPPQAAGDAATSQAAPGPPAARTAPAPTDVPQKIERSAHLALTTAPDRVQTTANGVVQATRVAGGRVTSSQVTTAEGGGSATFTLRIPATKLDAALAALSDLADVESLSQDTRDITSRVASAADRLGDARAERKALLRALGRADGAREIASLRRRLRLNRSEIAAAKGDLEALRRRANLATVQVTVAGTGAATDPGAGGAWTPGDAADDALRVLEVAVGVLLVGLAALVPLALLAALAGLGARAVQRRRRDQALDPA